MRHTLIHISRYEPGDDMTKHPEKGTQRFTDLMTVMREYGLLRADGDKVARHFVFTRGIVSLGYVWKVEWDE